MISTSLPNEERLKLEAFVQAVSKGIAENLDAVVLYGSAVRGGFKPGVSDLNVLIVLKQSIPTAHVLLAEALQATKARIEPFIVSRHGFERSMKAFAIKFQSIARQHHVLYGSSPFAGFSVDPKWGKFLAEQALRNLRLRSVRAFVVFGSDRKRYSHFLRETYASLFVDLAEPLRCENIDVPEEFVERITLFEKTYTTECSVLQDLTGFHATERSLSDGEVLSFHSRLFAVLDQAIQWVEKKWPTP